MPVPQPIFILASPRSFTSLICAMLGQHPEAYGVPELNLFIYDTLEQAADQLKTRRTHGLLRTVAQLYAGEQTILSIDLAQRWILKRIKHSTGEVYQELCRKVQPLRIIDKSPSYAVESKTLNRIQKAFPNAYYIHLVRHPRAMGESCMKLVAQKRYEKQQKPSLVGNNKFVSPGIPDLIDRSTNPPTFDFQYLWYKMQWRILDFLSTVPPEQQMLIRGEDLLNDPPLYFKKICEGLGLSWNESAFEAMLHPEESPYACFGPYTAQFGNDPNFLNSPAFRQRAIASSKLEGPLPWRRDGGEFHPLVKKLAQELGYE